LVQELLEYSKGCSIQDAVFLIEISKSCGFFQQPMFVGGISASSRAETLC
jgi:hypothetical protein